MNIGLLGQGASAEAILDALAEIDNADLLAVGDVPNEPWSAKAQATGAKIYSDFRSLIVEQPLDLLIVAGWVPGLVDYLTLAASRGVPVFRTAPPNRSFERFAATVREFEKHGTPLEVARPFCHEHAFRVLADTRAQFDSVFLGRATMHLPAAPGRLDDRGLLHACYSAVDLVVLFMGIPEIVFANVYDSARLGSGSGGETADTAVLTFRYANGASAVVTAAQVIGEPACQVRFDGPSIAAVIDGSNLTVHTRSDAPADVIDLDLGSPFTKQLREHLSGSEAAHRKAIASIQSHLPTMTVIEAAVLSSKTAQPESPDKLLQQHGLHLDSPTVSPFLDA